MRGSCPREPVLGAGPGQRRPQPGPPDESLRGADCNLGKAALPRPLESGANEQWALGQGAQKGRCRAGWGPRMTPRADPRSEIRAPGASCWTSCTPNLPLPGSSLVPVRGGGRCSRVANGQHVDAPWRGRRRPGPAATRPQVSGPRAHPEVALILSERRGPVLILAARGVHAAARGGAAQAPLLALKLRVAVQGQRHRHV